MSLNIKFTDAGKAALVNPANIGTDALDITHIQLGRGTYNPTGSETDLQDSIKTLTTFGADTVADNVIHVTIRDDSNDTYNLGEIGLRSGTGVLMGIVSTQGNIITQKGANDVLLLSADATITEVDITNLTFGGTEFMYPPATPTTKGVVEIATESHIDSAVRNKAVDPYELQQLLTRRLTTSLNDSSTTKIASAKAVYDLNAAINNINTLLTSDTNTLDTLQEIVNYIELNRDTLSALTVSSIAGLQNALNAKANTGHGHTISDISGLATALSNSGINFNNHTLLWSGNSIQVRNSNSIINSNGWYAIEVNGWTGLFFVFNHQVSSLLSLILLTTTSGSAYCFYRDILENIQVYRTRNTSGGSSVEVAMQPITKIYKVG
jgi:hypothetical protein